MSIWIWLLIGTGGAFAVSLVVSLAVAAILARIGREVSELIEFESWPSSSPTPSNEPATHDAEKQIASRHAHGG
jgi:hypothetical protein